MIETVRIDFDIDYFKTLEIDDKTLWALFNGRGQALSLRENDEEQQGRNWHWKSPPLAWRSDSVDIVNSPGIEIVGDQQAMARSQSFNTTMTAEEAKDLAHRINIFAAFLDRDSGPWWLYNHQFRRMVEVGRKSFSPEWLGEGLENHAAKVTLDLILKTAFYEDVEFTTSINNTSDNSTETGFATSESYVIENPFGFSVRPVIILHAHGNPIDFTIRNQRNGNGFRFVDESFIDGAKLVTDWRFRKGSVRLFPDAENSFSVDVSRSMLSGGPITLEPGENIIKVETQADLAIPDFYFKGRYAV